ncbi:ABC transporter ATP-binding protein [Aquabacterium sp.]|uniref:ABC transporter ATP-binding protein n=1 Tax=Aquabacterium sp. TaxID=1872578 RepID=UPI002C32F482|nr:ATP-binding cassette domain-containing protein [Aquabacterium sp.]HSW06050.1 ATP-binding cassette domain-containing protein [Aquabacterium sp.]
MLEVRQLHVSRGGKAVVHGFDLDVAAGEIVALLGPNGAGKSSIVLALAGAVARSQGRVRVHGTALEGLSPDAVRRAGLAIVPEGHHLLGSLSVHDNLRAAAMLLPAAEVEPAIARVLKILPELEAKLAQPGRTLSGGQKQMVCMAQALLARPKVLVVDELSLGLAPLVVRRLAEVVRRAAADGAAVLLIEQFTTLALSLANRACVLQRGRTVWSGGALALREQPEILHGSYLA